ncbi:hypothetical protein PMALA_045020 [Plasmodium malariae]|uniref:Uncharacterized protein n=1 Tax=Plasmodium malariae TaxID=5858 RepID=A0A1A8WPL2_PLAMA|nr:hypothetical protein PMALA_045020 [Plasmodium malariae]
MYTSKKRCVQSNINFQLIIKIFTKSLNKGYNVYSILNYKIVRKLKLFEDTIKAQPKRITEFIGDNKYNRELRNKLSNIVKLRNSSSNRKRYEVCPVEQKNIPNFIGLYELQFNGLDEVKKYLSECINKGESQLEEGKKYLLEYKDKDYKVVYKFHFSGGRGNMPQNNNNNNNYDQYLEVGRINFPHDNKNYDPQFVEARRAFLHCDNNHDLYFEGAWRNLPNNREKYKISNIEKNDDPNIIGLGNWKASNKGKYNSHSIGLKNETLNNKENSKLRNEINNNLSDSKKNYKPKIVGFGSLKIANNENYDSQPLGLDYEASNNKKHSKLPNGQLKDNLSHNKNNSKPKND